MPNRDAALDVTVVSQEAAGAGRDCVATAYDKKFHRYRQAVVEWGDNGIRLQPLVWSCEGRSHPDVARVMAYSAAALARRKSCSAQDVLKRWRADIGAALAIRRARMARRCLPLLSARAGFVIFGELDAGAGGRQAAEGTLGAYAEGDDEAECAPSGEAAAPVGRRAPGPVVPLVDGRPGAPRCTDVRLSG